MLTLDLHAVVDWVLTVLLSLVWLAYFYLVAIRYPRVERKLRQDLAARAPVLEIPCPICGRVGLHVGVEADGQSVSFLCPICRQGPTLHIHPVAADPAEPPLPESGAVRQARQVVEGMAPDE